MSLLKTKMSFRTHVLHMDDFYCTVSHAIKSFMLYEVKSILQ